MSEVLNIKQGQSSDLLPVVEMKRRFQAVLDAQKAVMKEGLTRDYGVIPGTQKPTLLKPGAEKLCTMFRLAPEFTVQTVQLGGDHREVLATCTLRHGPSGTVWASAHGSASTMESKYRYRGAETESTGKQVPKKYWEDRDPALIGGKGYKAVKDDNGQWIIHKKGDGKLENPDIADVYNTVLKIAEKRALIAATLIATAASDYFTQDTEDFATPEAHESHSESESGRQASSARPRAQNKAKSTPHGDATEQNNAPADDAPKELLPPELPPDLDVAIGGSGLLTEVYDAFRAAYATLPMEPRGLLDSQHGKRWAARAEEAGVTKEVSDLKALFWAAAKEDGFEQPEK